MQTQKKDLLATFWLVLGVAARLVPHPANVSPLTSLSLFGGAKLPRWKAFVFTMTILVISDILLARLMGYPAFGSFSIFTYSGFAAIVLAGSFLGQNASAGRTAGFLVSSSILFWTWTNFGTWLGESLYPHTTAGLEACYIAALPFLRNALAGDLVWGAAFFGSYAYAQKHISTMAQA